MELASRRVLCATGPLHQNQLPDRAAVADSNHWRLWTKWFLLWEIRNKALHGADSRQQAQAERRNVERMMIDVYDNRNQMEPSIQQLFCRDITAHFSKTVGYNFKIG
jgi:hypothetical protein